MQKFISLQEQEKVKNFKYKGGNNAYSYKYLWSPLAEWLLNHTPCSWAPNTITIAGFLINALGTILIAIQKPNIQPVIPWTLLFYSFCVFTYQTLDNIDGKQARKLKNSTPLGMIMDHGCDALGLIFLSYGVGRVICFENYQTFVWVFAIGVIFPFYLSAWSQYYSNGIMILGEVNAVDDGIPIVWILGIISYIFGQQFWLTNFTIFGSNYQANDFVAYGIVVFGIGQVFSIVNSTKENFTNNYKQALFDLTHLVLLCITFIFITSDPQFTQRNFTQIVFSLAFVMSRSTSYILVCTVVQSKYKQFHLSLLTFCFGYIIYFAFAKSFQNQNLVTYGILLICGVEYSIFVVSVSSQIAEILKIHIFTVFKPKI